VKQKNFPEWIQLTKATLNRAYGAGSLITEVNNEVGTAEKRGVSANT